MSTISDYKELNVWQRSYDLCNRIFKLIKNLPVEERYAISDQLRRASLSVPLNIGEGFERESKAERLQLMRYARGSLAEVETLLMLVKDNYADIFDIKLLDEVIVIRKMLNSFMKTVDGRHK